MKDGPPKNLEGLVTEALQSLGGLGQHGLSNERLAQLSSYELIRRWAKVLNEPATAIVLRDVLLRAILHMAWTSIDLPIEGSMSKVGAEPELLWDVYVLGRSIKEVAAEELNCDPRTAQRHLKRARRSLVTVIWAWESWLRSHASEPLSGPGSFGKERRSDVF